MKNKLILLTIIFSFLFISHQSLASTTSGIISSDSHYAWGENVGFIDFINITVTDSSLSGSIYGENIGWIDLSTIKNNNEGTLSDYAWGENVGWIDFSQVAINNDGVFTGQAYGENIGFITFNTTNDNKVTTDWRPLSSRTTRRSGGGGSYTPPKVIPPVTPIIPTTPTPCSQGQLFNITTGQPCTTYTQTPTIPTYTPTEERTLRITMQGEDVRQLQIYLNTHNYIVSTSGNGSPNNETTYFGQKTKNAVIKFQTANGLKPDGVVGKMTRSKMN